MTKQGQQLVDDLMDSIKTITDDYVKNLPAKETFKLKEVNLPIHRINNCFAFKVVSKDTCIQVLYGIEGNEQISITQPSLAWLDAETKDCTEAEFLEAYEKTLLIIQEAIFSVEV